MIYKILTVGATSTVKFFFSIPIGFALGLSYVETIITTSIGGIGGLIIFYYISLLIHRRIKNAKNKIDNWQLKRKAETAESIPFSRNKKRKIFSRRNKGIIQVLRSSGLYGIAVLSPVVLSIPFGAFIAAKYFSRKPLKTLIIMALSIIIWSLLLSTMVYFHLFIS